eukprot:529584-Pelagomonas_calceolata.AAC.2
MLNAQNLDWKEKIKNHVPPRPPKSNCTSMMMQSEAMPSGAAPWARGDQAGPRHLSFWLTNIQVVL